MKLHVLLLTRFILKKNQHICLVMFLDKLGELYSYKIMSLAYFTYMSNYYQTCFSNLLYKAITYVTLNICIFLHNAFNFAIFYMLAKYVPGDIKYIFTKFYRHISSNNEANRKFLILISNFSTRLWRFNLIMHCGIEI
jgi:hypothetical protein